MDAHVHLTGNVGGDVEYRNNTVPVASFRLACTPRVRKAGRVGGRGDDVADGHLFSRPGGQRGRQPPAR